MRVDVNIRTCLLLVFILSNHRQNFYDFPTQSSIGKIMAVNGVTTEEVVKRSDKGLRRTTDLRSRYVISNVIGQEALCRQLGYFAGDDRFVTVIFLCISIKD